MMIELDLGADARRVVDEVKSNTEAITRFPIETEKPTIRELTNRAQVVDIAVSGDVDPFTLKQVTERVPIPGTSGARRPPRSRSEDDLRRHGMTFDQVADAVRRSSLDLPGGLARTEPAEILPRTIGQAYCGAEFEDLVLWTRADGSRLRLGNVATAVDAFEETDQYARRLAFWIRLGIPISFLGTVALVPGLGVSVNLLSPFGFVLVLGIVVDDAMIVGEDICRQQEERSDGLRGSIEGAYEIAKPLTFAVLTTVAAVSPLLFVPGTMGRYSGSSRWW